MQIKADDNPSFYQENSAVPPPLLSLPVFKRGWKNLWGEARTRILFWYVLILELVFLAGIPAFRYLLFQRVDERVRREMAADMATFRALISHNDQVLETGDRGTEDLERLREQLQTSDRQVVPRTSKEDLMEVFRKYLLYRIPEDNTFLITFIDGKFYKSSPRARPKPLHKEADLMRLWAKQQRSLQGEQELDASDGGKLLYMVEPVQVQGQMRGVFVVAHTTAGERAEMLEALFVIIEVSFVLFLIALLLAWFAAGRVLAPLRTITATAQTISETDLSRRLPEGGRGELAELAATFNSMMDRLETAFETQREFINDAGHELRTPITIIRGHLELMGDDPAEQQETLALVVSELERMSRLVDDLILLAKAERTDFLHLATVDAAALTQELFTKARALAERDWQLDETARGQIVVDRERMTEAIINLAQNATQYTTRRIRSPLVQRSQKAKFAFGYGIRVRVSPCQTRSGFLNALPALPTVAAAPKEPGWG